MVKRHPPHPTTTDGVADITELGAATPGDAGFGRLVRPISEISDGAALVTGLTWQKLSGAQLLPFVLAEWLQWLENLCRSTPGGSATLVLAGHNIKRCVCEIVYAF